MNHMFFHEKRAELIAKHQAELAKFDAEEPEFNVLYDILADVTAEYPGIYTWHSTNFATIQIPEHMSREQFSEWLDYLEPEYLADYNMVKNEVHGSTVTAEYIHVSTDGWLHIDFNITQCKVIETKEYKTTYKTECNWE